MTRYQAGILYLALGAGALLGQSYSGALQSVTCSNIGGWATDGTPSDSQGVDIYDGTAYLLTVSAAPNSYVFYAIPPASLKDNQIHLISAYYGGTQIILSGSPMSLQCTNGAPGYQYYYTDTFQTINGSTWNNNGGVSVASGIGIRAAGSTAGLIAAANGPADPKSASYEVKSTLRLQQYNGGVYAQYLLASATAPSSGSSYFSVEVQNPQFNSTGQCSATLAAYQSVSGTVTSFLSTPIACRDYMQVRTSVWGSRANVMVNGVVYNVAGITLTSGMPGVGGSSMNYLNGISEVQLGPHDGVAPSPINTSTVTTDVYPTSVTATWQGAVDDPNGVGVAYYYVSRTGGTGTFSLYSYDASFYDGTVVASTPYQYAVTAIDFHGNDSPLATFLVATPVPGAIPPQRMGMRPTGSYWGGAGEQVDLVSGNLNYSLPLVTAVARGGLKATFGLSYNSENWVRVGAVNRLLGADTGYGFGWQFMLGSLLPVWGPFKVIQYYLFTDASGAQYRLNQQNNNVWNSSESTYVWYDAYANRLHFRNGTFWVMGCESAGGEQDAGTFYPTIVEDSNGNQILVSYLAGVGADWNNSSSRVSTIEDVRAQSCSSPIGYCSYSFAYASSPSGLQYLSSITSYVGTQENYSFTISQGEPLWSPNGQSFSTAGKLHSVTATPTSPFGYSWTFTYELPAGSTGTLGDGTLVQAQFPQGGHLRWNYETFQYETNRYLEEVQARYLLSTAGGSESTYAFIRPSADTPGAFFVHSGMTLDDASGKEKYWAFNTNTANFNVGLVSELQDRPSPGANPPFRDTLYTWAQDSVGNAYLHTVQTTISPGMAWAETTSTTQTVDTYGDVLTSAVTDYASQSTRTYTNTYKQYPQYYIFDRLSTSAVSNGSTNVTLVTNTYDASTLSSPSGTPREQDWQTYGAFFTYRGNLTKSVTPGRTINTYYDTTGTVISQDDNNGHSVSITTSDATNFSLPDKLDPNGTGVMPSTGLYNSVSLAPTSLASPLETPFDPSTAPQGTAAYTNYDTYGRVNYTLAPSQVSGSQNGAQTNYTYTYTAPWTTTATTTGASGTHWTKKTLDGLGRVASVQTGTGSTTITEVDTIYAPCACSPLGKMSQQSEPYPGTGNVVYTTYTYQAVGATKTVTLADGSVTTYTYWGNATLAVDAATKWKLYYSDAFGNLVSVIEPDPAVNPAPPSTPPSYPVTTANLPSGMLLTSYTYDLLNHLTGVSMPRMVGGTLQTQTRTFNYDPTTQRLTSTVNPENGTIQYTYNTDGTPASKIFNNGNKETYEYDTYQRLTKIHRFPGGTNEDANQLQTLTYDTLNSVSYPGMLTTATSAANVGSNYELTFQNQYTYTPAGNIASKTLYMTSGNHNSGSPLYTPASGTLTANYTYDSQGVLTSTSYPRLPASPLTLTYALDAMERPTGLTDQNSYAWVSGVTYNAANQLLTATFPSGAETWVYNSLFQLTQRTTGGGVMNMTYNYTAGANNGQIASSNDAVSGETVTYQYDALKRLLSATSTSGWSETYANDGFGNLTGMTGTGGAPILSVGVDWTTNRITPTGVGYDGNGNINQMAGPVLLGYDVANRMVSVGTTSSYAYDGGNRRVYANVSGTETIYLYGAAGEKLAAYAITGVVSNTIQFSGLSQNVYFAGRLISAEGSGVAVDRQGSVRARTGYPSSNSTYYPYGVEYSATGNDTEKYATYTRDNLTGLDYAANRYYASIWGRFTSPDPFSRRPNRADPSTWNRYSYTNGDPINGNDPTGLCDVVIAGITQNTLNGAAVQAFADADGADSVYPYSADSNTSSLVNKIGSALNGVVQVASQYFGANSSTFAAVAGLVIAAQDGKPINVTTWSGGAAAFTAAVKFLNNQGSVGQSIVSLIGHITYVAPGNPGDLYNNGNVAVVGGGLENWIVGASTSIPQVPALPTFYNDTQHCGHDFACLADEFGDAFAFGEACSTQVVVNQRDTGWLNLLTTPTYGDSFWYQEALWQFLSPGDTPSVTSRILP